MKNNEPINQTHPLITPDHLRRLAIVYMRQSTEEQVRDNVGSTEFQRGLTEVARSFGWHGFARFKSSMRIWEDHGFVELSGGPGGSGCK